MLNISHFKFETTFDSVKCKWITEAFILSRKYGTPPPYVISGEEDTAVRSIEKCVRLTSHYCCSEAPHAQNGGPNPLFEKTPEL